MLKHTEFLRERLRRQWDAARTRLERQAFQPGWSEQVETLGAKTRLVDNKNPPDWNGLEQHRFAP